MDDKFYMWCPACKRMHLCSQQPCPECQGRGGYTLQPVSRKVADECKANYACDGCMAYREHMA